MTRVLQVISDTSRRGPQILAVDLAPALAARGLITETVALVPGVGARLLDVVVIGRTPFAPRTLGRLRRHIREADVVLAQGSTTLPASQLAGLGTGVPIVYRSIGDLLVWTNTPMRRVRTSFLLRRCARVVPMWDANGARVADALGVDPTRIVTIPNAVDGGVASPATPEDRRSARAALGVPDDAPVALCLGALAPEKDVPAAIRAVASLPAWHLLVVGDGPERGAIDTAAAAQGDRIHVLGGREDVAPMLAAADVLLMPSRTEGMPAALVEAGLAGLPAVATDVGGISRIVLDGVTGRVVAPGDLEALPAALEEVWVHRHRFGGAARAHCAAHFTVEVVAEQWADLLDAVARESAVRS